MTSRGLTPGPIKRHDPPESSGLVEPPNDPSPYIDRRVAEKRKVRFDTGPGDEEAPNSIEGPSSTKWVKHSKNLLPFYSPHGDNTMQDNYGLGLCMKHRDSRAGLPSRC